MFTERFSHIRNWLKYEIEHHKENYRFERFFGFDKDPNGVLTKPGEEIHPLHRGIITAGLSFPSLRKIESLSEEKRRKVREAAWLNSISGKYLLNLSLEEGAKVAIKLDNNEAFSYLTANADRNTMVAFLSYHDKIRHFR